MGIMADQGVLDWDAPVTKYWPEFGKNGKGHTKVSDVMKHAAGLQAFSKEVILTSASTENIKKNVMGEMIENETQMW